MAKEAWVKHFATHFSPSGMSPQLGYSDSGDKDLSDINVPFALNKAISFLVLSIIILETWIL